jgi:hypothetical protein
LSFLQHSRRQSFSYLLLWEPGISTSCHSSPKIHFHCQ